MSTPLQRISDEAGYMSTADYLGTLSPAQRNEWRNKLLAQLRAAARPAKNDALSIHYLIQSIDHRDHAGAPPRV